MPSRALLFAPQHAVVVPPSPVRLRTGRTLSAIAVTVLFAESVLMFTTIRPLQETVERTGWSMSLTPALGLLLLACTLLHAAPRTAMLGAICLTAYLGAVIAAHVRVGDALLGEVLIPIGLVVTIWCGLYLRDPRVRALLPLSAP